VDPHSINPQIRGFLKLGWVKAHLLNHAPANLTSPHIFVVFLQSFEIFQIVIFMLHRQSIVKNSKPHANICYSSTLLPNQLSNQAVKHTSTGTPAVTANNPNVSYDNEPLECPRRKPFYRIVNDESF
jgi:hypothetical protein